MKQIADFARLLEVDVVALHLGFVPHDATDPLYREVLAVTRDLCDHCRQQRPEPAPGNRPGTGRLPAAILARRRARTICSSISIRPT